MPRLQTTVKLGAVIGVNSKRLLAVTIVVVFLLPLLIIASLVVMMDGRALGLRYRLLPVEEARDTIHLCGYAPRKRVASLFCVVYGGEKKKKGKRNKNRGSGSLAS